MKSTPSAVSPNPMAGCSAETLTCTRRCDEGPSQGWNRSRILRWCPGTREVQVEGSKQQAAWPALPLEEWRDTKATLHRYCQMVGKVRLALAPFRNHWWHVTLSLTDRKSTRLNSSHVAISYA